MKQNNPESDESNFWRGTGSCFAWRKDRAKAWAFVWAAGFTLTLDAVRV